MNMGILSRLFRKKATDRDEKAIENEVAETAKVVSYKHRMYRQLDGSGKAIGIDLGTTKSVAAVIEAGKPIVIPNAEGDCLTPSVVAINKTGERLVGLRAKRQAVTNPDNTAFSVKRLLGSRFRDPALFRQI